MPDDSASFFIGESVILHVRVAQAGGRTPVDPADGVTLVSLFRTDVSPSTAVSVTTTTFTHNATGDYTLSIPTDAMAVGQYRATIQVSSGPTRVRMLVDSFVLTLPG